MGGLEKFNRCFLKALNQIEAEGNLISQASSLYDTTTDERYYPRAKYKGFGRSRMKFVLSGILQGMKQDVIVLGHINLAIVGVVAKTLWPRKKLVLITHGIEVWGAASSIQKMLLAKADKIFAVSEYTRRKLIDIHGVDERKTALFYNTIDPYFPVPNTYSKSGELMRRYGLKESDKVLFTLCRLSSNEQYKGYDNVIKALKMLIAKYPDLRYVIAGKYDAIEKERIDLLLKEYGLTDKVILTGFVADDEIVSHYQLADVYIMPSKGEGFGIVFIEAMACGRRVIAGNKDGSVDALKNGQLGKLVDPENVEDIATSIDTYLSAEPWSSINALQMKNDVMASFGFDVYKQRLRTLLTTVINN
jgi:glycosyltransferase involved in cell wall biosynthesis